MKFLKELFRTVPNNLGRWETRTTDHQKYIKFLWSNHDHCGDHICKDPKYLKEKLQNKNNENKNNIINK